MLEPLLHQSAEVIDGVVQHYRATLASEEVGSVVRLGKGVARVRGLPGVRAQELVCFPDEVLGIALNLDADEVGVALLGDSPRLKAGVEVRRTSMESI